jgi:hypothetical protein
VIQRPPGVGTFQFVVLAGLRAAQLARGCRPRVDGDHKVTVLAQIEVSEGKVTQLFAVSDTCEPTPISESLVEEASAPVPTV